MGFAASDVNLYRFVGNRPTNETDPSGLQGGPPPEPIPPPRTLGRPQVGNGMGMSFGGVPMRDSQAQWLNGLRVGGDFPPLTGLEIWKRLTLPLDPEEEDALQKIIFK